MLLKETLETNISDRRSFVLNLRICYSTDGDYLLAGGNSKSVCLYQVQHRILLRKFVLSSNRSLDLTVNKLNSSKIKGIVNEDEISSENSDFEDRIDKKLPGASKTKSRLKIECRQAKFAPAGNYFAIASSDGLQVFSSLQEN